MTSAKTLKFALLASMISFSPAAVAQSGAFAVFSETSEQSGSAVDYAPYQELFNVLAIRDDERTLVAYEAIRESAAGFLTSYTRYLASVDVTSLSRDDQLAYWLNTRNFLVVKALSEERSLRNFDDKRGTPSAPGSLWSAKRISVNGVMLSIDDIERQILLGGWDNPYIIYGLYQGLEGGPALPSTPFNGQTVDAELSRIAAEFTKDRDIFRARRGSVRLGEFYEWYAPSVFDGDSAALLRHIREASRTGEVFQDTAEISYRNMSSTVERFRPRQSSASSGFGSSGGGSFGRGS
ncbi:MAG: DUF547 domain-containing protein [Pseudomonadota bacterium]